MFKTTATGCEATGNDDATNAGDPLRNQDTPVEGIVDVKSCYFYRNLCRKVSSTTWWIVRQALSSDLFSMKEGWKGYMLFYMGH